MVKKSAEMDPLNLSSVVVTGEDYPSDYFDDSEYGPDSESGNAEPGRQRAKKFGTEDIDLAYQLMDELDPEQVLSSQKWADNARETKEQVIVTSTTPRWLTYPV